MFSWDKIFNNIWLNILVLVGFIIFTIHILKKKVDTKLIKQQITKNTGNNEMYFILSSILAVLLFFIGSFIIGGLLSTLIKYMSTTVYTIIKGLLFFAYGYLLYRIWLAFNIKKGL